MHDIQPPITNEQELIGYRAGLARLNEVVVVREQALFASVNAPERLEHARQELYRIYRKRQGIIDAIAVYEQQRAATQSA